MSTPDFTHIPVLAEQTVSVLSEAPRPLKRLIDCTVGCGGHSGMLLERNPELEILGIDRDDEALRRAGEHLVPFGARVHLKKGRFSELAELAAELGWDKADGILMDIGVSSPQIDDPRRGFSFRNDGPLDMRMDRSSPLSAARVVNQYDEESLWNIFRNYGELDGRDAARLAEAIVRWREKQPFARTSELAALCDSVLTRHKRKGPPAPTLCFQALRIEVNGELAELEQALKSALPLLNPGGRIAVITFHSLEDRIVKNFFRDMAETCKCPPGLPVCVCGWKPKLKLVTRHPLAADGNELKNNPRAACAKLRAAEKIEEESVGQ